MTKTAFLFPGQGSQSIGMMAELGEQFPIVNETFAQASDVLGYDLWSLTQTGPLEELNKTEITQPAMLVSGIASWRVWREQGGALPDFFAGHSLGEYSALVASGVMAFEDAVAIVSARGKFMQQAVPAGTGAMAAVIGMDDQQLRDICEQAQQGGVVACANFNSPGQVVISGDKEAVERASALANEAGARRVMPLPVSVPSHCLLMKPAASKLQELLQDVGFSAATVPVIQNADVTAYAEAEQIREALARQLWQPVRWTETIEYMLKSDVNQFVECGPGKVLAGLNRRISREPTVFALTDAAAIQAALDAGSNK